MPELLLEAMSASSASSSEIEVMHIEENADGSAGISGSTASSSSSSPSAATVQPLSQPQQQQPQPQPIGIAQQPIRFNFHAVCSPSTWCWWEPVLYALFTLHSASMDRELRSASLAAAASWMQRVLVRPAAALGREPLPGAHVWVCAGSSTSTSSAGNVGTTTAGLASHVRSVGIRYIRSAVARAAVTVSYWPSIFFPLAPVRL